MRVTFVLAGQARVPIGGFAVVYEYANRLARGGHEVTVVHRSAWATGRGLARQMASEARGILRRHVSRIPAHGRPAWYQLSESVQSSIVPSLRSTAIPDGDAVIATSWEVAEQVSAYPATKGTKVNLIQHYETWAAPAELVDKTWRLPMHKVVISRWLRDLAHDLGEGPRTTYIPNGLDLARFRVLTPIESRDGMRVGMMYHRAEWKGTDDGIAALTLARRQVPGIKAVFFGTDRRPRIPDWVTYVHQPVGADLVRLYNSSAIFLHPSWTEGWPLPPAEAMACGCAVVAAANGGVSDYAEDGHTAVMASVRSPAELAEAVVALVEDTARRVAIAHAGNATIQKYTWERATTSFERLLLDLSQG